MKLLVEIRGLWRSIPQMRTFIKQLTKHRDCLLVYLWLLNILILKNEAQAIAQIIIKFTFTDVKHT